MKIDVWLFAKGLLMGAADIVPGVSGGTIAFITGIYERLILAIRSIVPEFFSLLSHRKPGAFWQGIDGTFLSTLLVGILTSVVVASRLIVYLLETHPIPLWSFFFGLILASVFFVLREVHIRDFRNWLVLVLGVVLAVMISRAAPGQLDGGLTTVFFSGAIAICAMILPGISGSFILVLLGSYSLILGAIQSFDLVVLMVFAAGCLLGLLTFVNVLAWALANRRQLVMALLTGFMIGALDKVWPWKETLSYRANRHGEQVPLLQSNVLPGEYLAVTDTDPQLLIAIICALGAMLGVLVLERWAANGGAEK